MEEVTYLQDGNNIVTSSRVVIGDATYATRNISSVRVVKGKFSYVGAFLLIGIGMTTAARYSAGQATADTLGYVLFFTIAITAWMWHKFNLRKLFMTTSGSDKIALKTTNKIQIMRFHDAIAQAISAR